ncbi:MAG: hypothetical protein ACRENP_00720 [Longimicrobiales bacterium]
MGETAVSLREHCARLSNLLAVISQQSRIGACDHWNGASDWLYVAASVESVSVNTTAYDDSTEMCGDAWDYPSARSTALSEIATEVSRFTFVWGGLEFSLHALDLPPVPKALKAGSGLIQRAAYYLTIHPRCNPVAAYKESLADIHAALRALNDAHWLPYFKLTPWCSFAGIGLNIVRLLRNSFAHGSRDLPEAPDQWTIHEVKLVQASLRTILLTLQELIRLRLRQELIMADWLLKDGVDRENRPFDELLRVLHLKAAYSDTLSEQADMFRADRCKK